MFLKKIKSGPVHFEQQMKEKKKVKHCTIDTWLDIFFITYFRISVNHLILSRVFIIRDTIL